MLGDKSFFNNFQQKICRFRGNSRYVHWNPPAGAVILYAPSQVTEFTWVTGLYKSTGTFLQGSLRSSGSRSRSSLGSLTCISPLEASSWGHYCSISWFVKNTIFSPLVFISILHTLYCLGTLRFSYLKLSDITVNILL